MTKYKFKTRQEVKGTGRGGGELSENEQLPENLIERFEESERRTDVDTQNRQSDIENKNNKAQEIGKKQWKNLGRQENIRGKMKVTLVIRNKVEGVAQKWLVFFEKNLNKFRSEDLQKEKNEREVQER